MNELSSYFTSVLPELAPDSVRSFGAGGQIYAADIWGGFNVSAETENPLFTFRRNDTSYANAKFLTNLHEAGKIGSTMEFLATHIGLRVVKFDGSAALTPAEMAAAKTLLASASVEIGLGADNVKIAEFTGLHLMGAIDALASDATNTCAASAGDSEAKNFIALRIPVPMQKNVELRGVVRFAQTPAAVLTNTANSWGFVVILGGVKVVST